MFSKLSLALALALAVNATSLGTTMSLAQITSDQDEAPTQVDGAEQTTPETDADANETADDAAPVEEDDDTAAEETAESDKPNGAVGMATSMGAFAAVLIASAF